MKFLSVKNLAGRLQQFHNCNRDVTFVMSILYTLVTTTSWLLIGVFFHLYGRPFISRYVQSY